MRDEAQLLLPPVRAACSSQSQYAITLQEPDWPSWSVLQEGVQAGAEELMQLPSLLSRPVTLDMFSMSLLHPGRRIAPLNRQASAEHLSQGAAFHKSLEDDA